MNTYKLTATEFDFIIDKLKMYEENYDLPEDKQEYTDIITSLIDINNKGRRRYRNIHLHIERLKYEIKAISEFHFTDFVRNITPDFPTVLGKPVKEILKEYKIIISICNKFGVQSFQDSHDWYIPMINFL